MKTSKKILSLILAVVLVVTTCSVGFTAFAADNDSTSYWTDKNNTGADEAFQSLNNVVDYFVPSLLGIEIGEDKTLADTLGIDKPEEASLSDIVKGASPLLMGVLGVAKADDNQKKSIIMKHLGVDTYSGMYDRYFSYLNEDDATISFFDLYQFCLDNKSSSNSGLKSWCNDTLTKLDVYLDLYDAAVAGINTTEEAYAKLSAATTLEQTKEKQYKGVAYKDLAANETGDIKPYTNGVEAANKFFKSLGVNLKINDPAEALYYYYSPNAEAFVNGLIAVYLADGKVTSKAIASTSTNITVDNVMSILDANLDDYAAKNKTTISKADFIKDYSDIITTTGITYTDPDTSEEVTLEPVKDMTEDEAWDAGYKLTVSGKDYKIPITGWPVQLATSEIPAATAPEVKNDPRGAANSPLRFYFYINPATNKPVKQLKTNSMTTPYNNIAEPYYQAYLIANNDANTVEMYGGMLKACYMDIDSTNSNLGVYRSSAYDTIIKNALVETEMYEDVDQAIEDAQITDAQITAASTYFQENELIKAEDMKNYLNSANCAFSAEASNAMLVMTSAHMALVNALNNKNPDGTESSKSVVELFKAVAFNQNPYNLHGINTVYDVTNYSVSSVMLYNYVGSEKIGTSSSTCEPGTKTANAPVIFKEIYKYNLVKDTLNDENNKFHYADSFIIPDEYAVDIVNSTINGYIDMALGDGDIADIVLPIIEGLTETLDASALHDTLVDVWKNLANKPIETIFNLLPTVVILLDELIVPILFNQPEIAEGPLAHEKDAQFNLLYDALFSGNLIDIPALTALTLDNGNTAVGISQLSFDLNSLLPGILEWFKYNDGTEDGKKEAFAKANAFVKTYADRGYAEIPDGEAPVSGKDVLSFTGIYVADKAIMGVSFNELLKGADLDANVATGLVELIDTFIGIADEAVLDYVKEQETNPDVRYTKDGIRATEGLNDLFTALPQLIDRIGKGLLKHFNVDSDWTYCFDGKLIPPTADKENLKNKSLVMFKDTQSENDSTVVLETFVDIFIGHQLNAFIDLFNDLFSDPNNDITKNLPLVQSLLAALGGFGEQSIITDLVDGLFQLKRTDDVSFQLAQREATGFVGFSTESGIYLIANVFSNLDTTNPANNKGIVPFILSLVQGNDTKKSDSSVDAAAMINEMIMSMAAPSAPYLTLSSKNAKYNETLTKSNIAKTDELVTKLDNLLASLLKDTTINGFDLTSTDSILSGVISAVSRYIGAKNTSDLVNLIDQYLNVVVADNTESTTGKVDKNKLYTSEKLSSLVIETYCLIENIADQLLNSALNGKDANGIIADAICGIISPDAVGVRMTEDYKATAKILLNDEKNVTWADVKANTTDLKFGFSKGDKNGFYHALGESLNGIAAIIGAALTASYTSAEKTDNYYSALLYPVMSKLAKATGAPELMAPSSFNAATDAEKLVDGIIAPVSNLLAQLYKAPASFLLNLIKGLAAVLEDDSVKSVITNAVAPIKVLLNGVVNIVDTVSPTLAEYLQGVLDEGILKSLDIQLPEKNIIVTLLTDVIEINGAKLSDYVKIESMDLAKVANAKTPGEVLLIVYTYLVDTVLSSNILSLLDIDADLVSELKSMLSKLSSSTIIDILLDVLDVVKNPTEVYWTFREYASKLTGDFSYPKTITKKEADKAVEQIDGIVNDVFPLLNKLGVTDIAGLSALVNDNLYTNEILTTIATAVYGGIENAVKGNKDVADVIKMTGMDFSPKGLAKYLTDKSYGTTYSSAATTLKNAKSWASVKKINWGFTDGTAKAQKGFINGLAALVRPVNGVLSVFLAEGKITPELSKILTTLVNNLNISESFKIAEDSDFGCTLKLTIKKAQLTLVIDSNNSKENSTVKLNLKNVLATLTDTINDIHISTNGYEGAIIPILEAFMCKDVKTYSQYKSDIKSAKDNLVIDVLNPIFGLVNDVIANPIGTITKILPNVAYFIDSNGLMQAISNLLAPITAKNGLLGVLDKYGFNVDDIIEMVLGEKLGDFITELLGADVKLNLQLTNLAACNIQDIVYPLVSSLLEDAVGIKLPKFTFEAIASHGTLKTGIKSAAKNADGKFITQQVIANQGEVLIAVLRYVANVVIDNTGAIKDLLLGIEAISSNETLKNVIEAVLAHLHAADADDFVRAIFYFLTAEPTDSYYDYSGYKGGKNNFDYDEIDAEFCAQLGTQLDGIVDGVFGLLSTLGVANIDSIASVVNDNLYTDDLITTIATGLFGAIDGVKVGDMGSLADVLALTDIDFTTAGVAKLLTDKSYGKQYKASAKAIASAKSWDKVNASKLSWDVTDRASFLNALCAILRPVYGVLDVIFNDGALNIFNLVSLPGSNGYESTLVPILEALGVEGLKTMDELKADSKKAYDNILLDVLNPVFDKIEDILDAPFSTLGEMLPSIGLYIANGGYVQSVANLLTPVSALLDALRPIVDINVILDALGITEITKELGIKLDIYDLKATLAPFADSSKIVPLINLVLSLLIDEEIVLPDINWYTLASHGEYMTASSAARNAQGKFERKTVKGNAGETLLAVLRYLEKTIVNNAKSIEKLLMGIDAIKKNATIKNILGMVFDNISKAKFDEIIKALFYFLENKPRDSFFDFTEFQTKANDFSFGDLDEEFCRKLAPMLDGLVNGLLGDKGGLNGLIGGLLYKDELVSKLATGLYGAIEGVKLNDSLDLNTILSFLDIDFSTDKVASLLVDPAYGESFAANAAVIKAAGSWSKVNPASLHWGVKDRNTFEQALVAVLRPLYGVLDVLLNDGSLNIANIVSVPGSDGYSSSIVPLLEAFNCINIRTQYQYREDMSKAYDAILLDVLDPLLDKVEDILNAPVEMVADILPNLALFFANDGLLQIIDNLLTPVSAILDSLRPVLDVNELLDVLGLDVSALLSKIGLNIDVKINLYDLKGTLRPLIGAENIVGLLNKILGIIKISGNKLGIVLPEVDWLKLASHGEVVKTPSQAATHGTRIRVIADQDETLIAVLRFVIDTINYQGNYDAIVGLLGGLLGGLSDSIAGVVDQVLGMLKGDSDEVILNLVDLLQTIAG